MCVGGELAFCAAVGFGRQLGRVSPAGWSPCLVLLWFVILRAGVTGRPNCNQVKTLNYYDFLEQKNVNFQF